jgi:hypothetical protein
MWESCKWQLESIPGERISIDTILQPSFDMSKPQTKNLVDRLRYFDTLIVMLQNTIQSILTYLHQVQSKDIPLDLLLLQCIQTLIIKVQTIQDDVSQSELMLENVNVKMISLLSQLTTTVAQLGELQSTTSIAFPIPRGNTFDLGPGPSEIDMGNTKPSNSFDLLMRRN